MLLGHWHRPQEQQQEHQRHHRLLSHQQQQHHQLTALLIALILLQQADFLLCRPLAAATKRLPDAIAPSKRTIIAAGGGNGGADQPEQIFSVSDQIGSNYDEYPMVVPKRAALLLDRLMVALHHALARERSGSRHLSDFYGNKNAIQKDTNDNKTPADQIGEEEFDQGSPHYNMYSDDDPNVVNMDYDFKDLNSINRATGETLMAKSFQRRASKGLDVGGDIGAASGVALLAAADDEAGVVGDGGGGGRNTAGSRGRMYWRCYFNAVSCF